MAIAGVGTTFSRSLNGTTYTTIGEINSITGPTMSRATIDTTALDTAGGYRTFITGFRNPGTITLNMNFTIATYGLMKSDFESDTPRYYRITLPDPGATTIEFQGLVTELPLTIPADDKVTANVTIQITGEVEVTS